MSPTPQFSVIIPFRNSASTLPATLDSLLAQTFEDWEALIVDDASEDNGAALVQQVSAKDGRIVLIKSNGRARARGVAATRNLGLARARGEIIAFLDADDLWDPRKLERQLERFGAGAQIVFSAFRRIDEKGALLNVVPAQALVRWEDALAGNPIGCLTGAYRHASFPNARMPENLSMHEDYAFWLSLLRTGAVAEGIPEVLAYYRVCTGSASSRKLRAALAVWAILRQEDLALSQRILGFLRYAMKSIRVRI